VIRLQTAKIIAEEQSINVEKTIITRQTTPGTAGWDSLPSRYS